MTKQNEEFTSMNEVTEYAKIGKAAIYSAIKKGRLKANKKGRFWKITREDIDHYRLTKYNRDERILNGEKLFSVEKGTFSVHQVAKIISDELKIPYNMQRVYHLIRTGQLKAARIGSAFIIKRDDLVSILEKEKGIDKIDYRQLKFSKTA